MLQGVSVYIVTLIEYPFGQAVAVQPYRMWVFGGGVTTDLWIYAVSSSGHSTSPVTFTMFTAQKIPLF